MYTASQCGCFRVNWICHSEPCPAWCGGGVSGEARLRYMTIRYLLSGCDGPASSSNGMKTTTIILG